MAHALGQVRVGEQRCQAQIFLYNNDGISRHDIFNNNRTYHDIDDGNTDDYDEMRTIMMIIR